MTKHQDSPVWYEAHPVTPERKAQIRAQGFVIVDAVFAPEGHQNPAGTGLDEAAEAAAEQPSEAAEAAEPAKRGRKTKAEAAAEPINQD